MELPLVSPASCELRSVIRFLAAKKISAKDIHTELCQAYGEGCMSSGMVRRWVREFKNGRTDVHDEPRAGRHRFRTNPLPKSKRQCLKIDGLLFGSSAIWFLMSVKPPWLMRPRNFSIDTKLTERNSWILSLLDRKGLLLCDFMRRGTTINSDRYCETLKQLRRAIRNKRRGIVNQRGWRNGLITAAATSRANGPWKERGSYHPEVGEYNYLTANYVDKQTKVTPLGTFYTPVERSYFYPIQVCSFFPCGKPPFDQDCAINPIISTQPHKSLGFYSGSTAIPQASDVSIHLYHSSRSLSWVCKAAVLGPCQCSVVVVVSNEKRKVSPYISITAVVLYLGVVGEKSDLRGTMSDFRTECDIIPDDPQLHSSDENNI
ncbi:hypothetical protein LAZ67_7003057 [Cordylochernes scorpioides]|uniref:Mos1 transposase HTH domain-containing protein n=1 Tax=Cordylochernes scorpioides TaxID=51811 RepID=A0ABY6KNR5_9ARAC|nr:hypothetical protein LAZ67_7003057 [Cordylochernes scorpioides]